MNASFNRWQLANAYGAFGTVTKERIEFVVEGTTDEDPDAATWREYAFKGKPGDLRRIPRQFAPYHLRLDWLMWFLPLGHSAGRLVHGVPRQAARGRSRRRCGCSRRDPFGGAAPRWVRAVSYRYRFTTRAEFRESRARWSATVGAK